MLGLSGLATHFHVLESMPHMARTEGSHGAAGHMDAYQRDLVHLSARPPPAAGPAAGVTAEDVELVPLEPIHEEEGEGEGEGGGEEGVVEFERDMETWSHAGCGSRTFVLL